MEKYLQLEEAQEYVRQSLRRRLKEQGLGLNDLFRVADADSKGYLSCYDLELVLTATSGQNS